MGEADKKKRRTITEIRESKRTGEKMVYMSVPDYTSAQWAEMGGVDVAVVGDSLAMIAHGHPNTVPATMEMMVMHSLAVRRGAPNTFVLGCMPYQSYNTVDRALTNATRFMQEAGCDAVKPQGGKSQAHILSALVGAGIPTASHIGLTPHTVAMFGGFKIQGRTAEAAMKILEDAFAIQDAGCFMLDFAASWMGEADKKKRRTITEIRDSKRTGEKMVYMSVPDYTSAQWAEMGGVDVAVVGDSLAMIAHGHPNTVPATMEMMVMHSLAVRRGAPNTFVLGCMPYQSYNTVDRALTNATRFMQEAGCDAVKPQGGKSQAHILSALVGAGIPTASPKTRSPTPGPIVSLEPPADELPANEPPTEPFA